MKYVAYANYGARYINISKEDLPDFEDAAMYDIHAYADDLAEAIEEAINQLEMLPYSPETLTVPHNGDLVSERQPRP
jgi:hypothetical protein